MITTWCALTPSRLQDVARLLATAFDEPATRWLVPDPARRQNVMPGFFSNMIKDAFTSGSVDILTEDDKQPLAAAIWFDSTHDTPTTTRDNARDPGGGGDRWWNVFGPDAPRWLTLEALMDAHHVTGPHHYLFAIGVHPAVQGRGLGGLLLDHAHAQRPCHPHYLEATTPASRRLYARHGYTDLGELVIPDGPCLWRMLRPATRHLPPEDDTTGNTAATNNQTRHTPTRRKATAQ